MVRPVRAVEWLVPPVVVKVAAMATYSVLAVAEYLQTAALSVVKDSVVWLAPTGRVEAGEPPEGTGGLGGGSRAWVAAMTADD